MCREYTVLVIRSGPFEQLIVEYEVWLGRAYGSFRPVVKELVDRYLDCGNPRSDFAGSAARTAMVNTG